MKKRSIAVLVASLMLAAPARPHTFNFTAGQLDRWVAPPMYRINTSTGPNITGTGVRSVTQVINSAFATWAAAPNAAAIATFDPTAGGTISSSDRINTICFTCTGDFSKDSSTLAVTSVSTIASGPTAGSIVDADIAFNPAKNFSTDNSGNQDLETVAVHEIGHFFGLSHSGVVRAVMFPFAPPLERTLGYDDDAGISVLYPGTGNPVSAHSISGTVRLGAAGVFAAHVYAESQTNFEPNGMIAANVRKTPVSALTDAAGAYLIRGVPDDQYVVVAEPLDLPVSNADVPDYSKAFGKTSVDTNFTTRPH